MRFIGRSCDAFQSKRISVVPRPTPIAPQATEVSSVTWRIWEFLTFSSFVLCHRVIKKFDAITVQLHSIYIYINSLQISTVSTQYEKFDHETEVGKEHQRKKDKLLDLILVPVPAVRLTPL